MLPAQNPTMLRLKHPTTAKHKGTIYRAPNYMIILKPGMSHELWDSAEKIVRELGKEIERNEPNSRSNQPGLGWQYNGKFFVDRIDRLKVEMKAKGYNVLACTVFHFSKNAKIRNPTKHYILLPIEGSSILKPAERPLPKLQVHIVYDEPVLESDGGVDMICMALEEKHGEKKVSKDVEIERVELANNVEDQNC